MNLDTPTLEYLELDELHPAEDNVRTELRDIPKLTASVKAIGILEPLIVTPNGDGYTIVAGARRHAAAKGAKLTTVPCIVRPAMTTGERVEAMGSENLQRDALTPIEEATVYQRLAAPEPQGAGMSQRTIAEHFACNQSNVSKKIKLLQLPPAQQAAVNDGRLHVDVAVKLVQLKAADPKVFEKFVTSFPVPQGWSVDEKVAAIQRKKRHEKLAKPYVAKGLKHLGQMNWMKYDDCTEAQATAIYFNHADKVKFARLKPEKKPASDKPKKETAAQKRAREARELADAQRAARQAEKRAAFTAAVHTDGDQPWSLLGRWLFDLAEQQDEELDDLLAVLELAPVGDTEGMTWPQKSAAVDAAVDRLDAYLATDEAHARRLAIAIALTVQTWRSGSDLIAEQLRIAAAHGYELDDGEQATIARADEELAEACERGYRVAEVRMCRICRCTEDNACDGGCTWVDDDLCSSCTDAVDTTHDPDCPTSVTEVKDDQLAKDSAFADANDLAPGDEVHEDGSITRADA